MSTTCAHRAPRLGEGSGGRQRIAAERVHGHLPPASNRARRPPATSIAGMTSMSMGHSVSVAGWP